MEDRVPLAEKHVQKKVIDYARSKGFLALKINVGSQRGYPDYVLIDPEGWHVWIEFKKKDEKLRKLQDYRRAELMSRTVLVLVVDNAEDGIAYVDDLVTARVSEKSDEDAAEPRFGGLILGPGIREN